MNREPTRSPVRSVPVRKEEGKVLTLDAKAGDRVEFGKYAGTEITLDGGEPLILREEDILGVIER